MNPYEKLKSKSTISIGQLNVLLRLHPQPIKHVVYMQSHRNLILKLASHLDAFSGYPFRT